MILRKLINAKGFFVTVVVVFILSLATSVYYREGKDLKVSLFGVEQVLQKKSPYDNPTDPPRPLFRYAPGFAILLYPFLLKSKMVSPFKFENINPSIFAWFFVGILSLFMSALVLLNLIPSSMREMGKHNLRLSFLMAAPLIGYELANGQNKLIALFFMLMAILLFERHKMLLSAIFFCLALTVYIPLLAFIFYFVLKGRGRFILNFAIAALIVFVLVPSLVFGFRFNIYLLKDWFVRCLKPFFFTTSYSSYVDLRHSSQSLPSAVGRIFTLKHNHHFNYFIPPALIHIIIRAFSAVILFFSCFAVWKSSKTSTRARGLEYITLLALALILPQYCLYYTWSWLFVFYFVMFNYINYPEVSPKQKQIIVFSTFVLFICSCSIAINPLNDLSFLFWGTLIAWSGIVTALTQKNIPAS